jgi:WD40 repeat protein
MYKLPEDFSNFLKIVASELKMPDGELDTLGRALDGQTAKKIAQDLGLSDPAIRKRLGSIYDRFEIPDSVTRKLDRLKEILLDRYNALQSQAILECKGDLPNISVFYGREEQQNQLNKKSHDYRLIAILGPGGIGKTSLVAKFITEAQPRSWDKIIWYSLITSPPIADTIQYLIEEISGKAEEVNGKSESKKEEWLNTKIRELVNLLKSQRCLIVFDNLESILSSGYNNSPGYYKKGYKEYEDLFRLIVEVSHKSCLILTSREKPRDIEILRMKSYPIAIINLKGLETKDALELFKHSLSVSNNDDLPDTTNQQNIHTIDLTEGENKEYAKKIINDLDGNPFLLKIVASDIRESCGGNVLDYKKSSQNKLTGSNILGDILRQQIDRLSDIEKTIIYWLAIEREFVSSIDLKQNIITSISESEIFETLKNLERRYLIQPEGTMAKFSLHPVMLEYVTEELIAKIFQSITEQDIQEENSSHVDANILNSHALFLTRDGIKEHVRTCQRLLILEPLGDKLISHWGNQKAAEKLKNLVARYKKNSFKILGYINGNIAHLLSYIEKKLSIDFSEAYFKALSIKDVLIENADFSDAIIDPDGFIYTIAMDSILSITFSKAGDKFATGGADGAVYLWDFYSKKKLVFRASKKYPSHTNWVRAVAFSPNTRIIASCSDDCTIKLWNVRTGKCCFSVEGHKNWVSSIAFHPNGELLASGSQDGKIKFWRIEYDIHDNACLELLDQIETERVWSIAFSPDGKYLASGSDVPSSNVKLWDSNTYKEIKSFNKTNDKQSRIFKVIFNANVLAAAGENGKVYLWDITNSNFAYISTLDSEQELTIPIRSICFNDDGNILATASDHGSLVFWKTNDGNWKNSSNSKSLNAHNPSRAWSIAFHPSTSEYLQLVSSGDDRTIKLWKIDSEFKLFECDWEVKGYSRAKWTVSFSPDGKILASGSDEYLVELWDVYNRKHIGDCKGHTGRVWSVAFSPNGETLCSGSDDGTLVLWYTKTRECLKILKKPNGGSHESPVWSVAYSPDGKIIASGGEDRTVSLWNVEEQCFIKFLEDKHTSRVWSVAFSPNGEILASGSDDGTINLWKIEDDNYEFMQTLERPKDKDKSRVWSVAFSSDSQTLASGNHDGKIDFWFKQSDGKYKYENKKIFQDCHDGRVWSVAFNPLSDTQTLVSSGDDKTVKSWDLKTGQCKEVINHEDWVCGVTFSHDGSHIASCSKDARIKILHLDNGKLDILKKDELYQGMNITSINGLDKAEIDDLKRLGAFDENDKYDK